MMKPKKIYRPRDITAGVPLTRSVTPEDRRWFAEELSRTGLRAAALFGRMRAAYQEAAEPMTATEHIRREA